MTLRDIWTISASTIILIVTSLCVDRRDCGIRSATSRLNAPGNTIAITGDSDDADAGVGSILTIVAELDSTGTSLNGGGDDDSYDFFYPVGVTNSGTITIADTGGTDDVMIHGTAAAEELFFTTADPPTTEQVTRGTNIAEPVIILSDIEAVTLLGGDGNDIFHVQPSMLFPITVDGNAPSFGGAGVPPGDQFDLDTFGNSFTINGKTIFVANGAPNPFLGITFLDIETVPLTPASAGPDQSFDFNSTFTSGGTTQQTPTQAGSIGVTADTIFTTGNFGWQGPISAFNTGANTGVAANLINDGHVFFASNGAVTNTFTATVANGWVMATIAFGSDATSIVGMQIENADDDTVIASGLSTATGETDHVTVLVQDGTLDVRFRDPFREPGTFRTVSLKGIDIETDGGTGNFGFLSMGFATPGTLSADGTTVDAFTLSAAEPNSLVTVETTLGTLSGTDADPNVEGSRIDASAWLLGGVTIVGSSGSDTLTGSAGDDLIIAGSGHDVVSGGTGNDVIAGGSGRDVLSGDGGDDTISGGQGRDTIRGDGGNDELLGGAGADVLEGADGSDSLFGGSGTDSLVGGAGNDILNNIAVADDFNGTVGDDLLIGGDAPQARPAPAEAIPAAAPSFSLPPSLASSSTPAESDSDEQETLDAAFDSPLLFDLLEL
jgi:Ca2+-binding RTX toxin-like protein